MYKLYLEAKQTSVKVKKNKHEKKMKVDEWPSEATSSVRVELPLGWARLRKVASHSFVGG